jgi:putative endonuclease
MDERASLMRGFFIGGLMTNNRKQTDRQKQGNATEQLAHNYLLKNHLKTVEKNFNCRYGEIDLIMQDGDMLVFVEVRYRQSQQYGGAVTSVDYRKQRKLINTANFYLQKHRLHVPTRFDVVAVDGSSDKGSGEINWIKGAFSS